MRPPLRASGWLCLLAVIASACTSSASPAPPRFSEVPPAPTSTQLDELGTGWTSCERVALNSDSQVEQIELVEASGLAASVQFPDVMWAHNDSGSAAGVFGVGLDGTDHGFFALADRQGIDVEDIALVDGRIHLADIGDNDRKRSSVQIYVFDEPEPGTATDTGIAEINTIELTYPDEPTDAEALLVDPLSDEVVILSKDLDNGTASTRIYSFALPDGATPTDQGMPIEMDFVGEIDVAGLESQATEFTVTAVLFPGLLTAADISTDGRLIAVRTYGTVWLYPRLDGQTMAEALQGEPCEGGSAAENQGESLTILPDGDQDEPGTVRYVTVSEGNTPVINVVTVELR